MSQCLSVVLSDEAFAAIERHASVVGSSPDKVAADSLEQSFFGRQQQDRTESEKEEARRRFERHFGEISSGCSTGADNDAIDADLAREYADNYENS